MTTIDYKAIEALVEKDLLESRRLLTRSVTDNPKYSTLDKIRENYTGFIREVFKVHKAALSILRNRILYLEDLISKANGTSAGSQNTGTAKLIFWKHVLEKSYDAFVWMNVGMDRSSFKKVFKGKKHGDLAHQNIESVLGYVGEVNKNQDEIAIPLDFCSITPICDVLRVSFSEENKARQLTFIEMKSGRVNNEMLDTIHSGTTEGYLKFFDAHGEGGIKQMERYFRQAERFERGYKLVGAELGAYENPDQPKQNLLILSSEVGLERFSDKVSQLLEKASKREYAVGEVDGCLIMGAVNTCDEKTLMLGEYDIRLYIYHSFINPAALDGAPLPENLPQILAAIKLIDWLEGLGSVVLNPILLRKLPDAQLMDLLLGRIRLKLFFHVQSFIDLCSTNGLDARLIDRKGFNRLHLSDSDEGLSKFNGEYIQFTTQESIQVMGDGTYHEMVFNWVHPRIIIDQTKHLRLPHAS